MSSKVLERQLADLQQRVAHLETQMKRQQKGAWRQLVAWEKDDKLFREAVRLGAEWRKKANARGK